MRFFILILWGMSTLVRAASTVRLHLTKRAVRLKLYLRHLLAKKLYSDPSAEVRSSGMFGKPVDLRLVFQRERDFYHDLGLAHRRS